MHYSSASTFSRISRFCFIVLCCVISSTINAQIRIGLHAGNIIGAPIRESQHLSVTKSEIPGRPTAIVRMFSDTLPDTLKPEKKHSPKTASVLSACLPGAGQIYNKKAWKLAIIYPALGGLGFGIGWNHHYFKYYRDALRARYDDDPNTIDPMPLYSDDRLVTTKNYYQRNRDLCVIGFAAVYLLQVIDAAVDAHLFYFDVGPDLSMRWSPVLLEGQTPAPGVSFGFSLR